MTTPDDPNGRPQVGSDQGTDPAMEPLPIPAHLAPAKAEEATDAAAGATDDTHGSDTGNVPAYDGKAPGGDPSQDVADGLADTPVGNAAPAAGPVMAPEPIRPGVTADPAVSGDPETPRDPGKKKGKGHSVLREVLEWVLIVAVAVGLAVVVRTFVVEPYEIPTESMIETIEVGDRILGEKITYRNRDPQAGDIVTFIDPDDPDTTLIKRIIATPGQTVSFEDGAVYVDGKKLDEPYTMGKPTGPLARHSSNLTEDISYPYTLGEDEYWVMGDNRTNSLDSRYFGPIKRDSITSKAWLTFWPLNDVQVF